MSDFDKREEVEKQIAELESSQGDNVPVEQVKQLLQSVKDLFEGRLDGEELDSDHKLYGELGELARYINNARKELREFQPQQMADKEIPDASEQLDAIVKQTEKATGKIMDSAEQLEALHTRVKDRLLSHEPPLDEDVMVGIDDAFQEGKSYITDIFEACNFQDITGQRIMKIVSTLGEIERQVLRMVLVFGLDKKGDHLDDSTKKELSNEVSLLEGPQLPGKSLDQDDIDDILDKLL